MPLTLSHPAAVLPLRALGLPMTALVVGSMVPDVPMFVRWHRGYLFAHSLEGALTLDAVLTVAAVVLWFAVVRDALVDLAPDPVRSRLAGHVALTPRQWALVVPAAWAGALTHVAWDAFTHADRWGVRHVGWLQDQHAGLPGYRWAQYASGIVGLVVVGVAVIAHLRGLPRRTHPAARPPWATAALLACAAVVVVLTVAAASVRASSGLHAAAFHGAVTAILASGAAALALALGWRAVRARDVRRPASPGVRRPRD